MTSDALPDMPDVQICQSPTEPFLVATASCKINPEPCEAIYIVRAAHLVWYAATSSRPSPRKVDHLLTPQKTNMETGDHLLAGTVALSAPPFLIVCTRFQGTLSLRRG